MWCLNPLKETRRRRWWDVIVKTISEKLDELAEVGPKLGDLERCMVEQEQVDAVAGPAPEVVYKQKYARRIVEDLD